jgi:hypothetical protein
MGTLLASGMPQGCEHMQQVEKSNVVQIRDYAHRRGKFTLVADGAAAGLSALPGSQIHTWPRTPAPYPGGIDDLPV